jgi:hypothetical protein
MSPLEFIALCVVTLALFGFAYVAVSLPKPKD